MALDGIPLNGGLNLVRHDQNSVSGELRKCSNFERDTVDGYSKIDGFHGIDGIVNDMQMAFARVQFVRATYAEGNEPDPATAASYVAGDQYLINNVVCICIYASVESMTDGANISDVEQNIFIALSELLVPAVSNVSITISEVDNTLPEEPDSFLLTSTSDDFWGDVSYSVYTAAISALEQYWLQFATVPGGQGQTYGLHFFNNQQYAIREYRSFTVISDEFTAGIGTEPINGDIISNEDGTWWAEVVKAYADDGSWGRGDEECRVLIRDEHGTIAAGDAIGHVTDIMGMLLTGYPMGVTPLGSDIGIEFTSFCELESTDAESEGALWVATSSGWREVDMLREVPFRNGAIEPGEAIRLVKAIDATAATATTGETKTATNIVRALSTGIVAESPATNADLITYLADVSTANYSDIETSSPVTSIVYIFRGFDFSIIPDSATILGVEVLLNRQMLNSTASDYFKEARVRLVGVGDGFIRLTSWAAAYGGRDAYDGMQCTQQDKADTETKLPTAWSNRTYGGLRDLWGEASINSSEIRDSERFGVWIEHQGIEGGGTPNLQLAYLRMTVFYQKEDGRTYALEENATTGAIEVRVVSVQKTSGSWDTSTAAGYLTIICDKDSDKSQLITDGYRLYENDDATGDQYLTLSGPDYPVTMPGRDQMDAASKQFEFINENFYASARWNAFYGVSGVGPAFCYDGTFFTRIRTELLNDVPVCISRHHNMLALGFDDAIVAFSAQNDPLNFVALDDSFIREFGAPVTNLHKMVSDTLGVFCRTSIHAAVGTDVSLQTRIISPVTGAFPYTVRNVSGRTVGVDNWGLFVVDTTDRFGDFVNGRLSKNISPFLIKRTQERGRFPEMRPLFAYLSRSKNQYRFVSRDGKQVTATFTPEGLPEFTIQDLPYPPIAASSDMDNQGRERIAMTFDYSGPQSSYLEEDVVVDNGITEFPTTDGKVVAMDSGHSFDGDVISAYLEVSTNDNGSPLLLKKGNRLVVYGQAEGSVDVTVSHSVDNGPMVEFGDFAFNPTHVNASDEMIPASMVVTAEADYFSHAYRFEVSGTKKVVFQYMIDDNNAIAKTQGNLERGR